MQTTGVKSLLIVFEHREQMLGPRLLSTSPAMRNRSRTSRRKAGLVFTKRGAITPPRVSTAAMNQVRKVDLSHSTPYMKVPVLVLPHLLLYVTLNAQG